MSDTLLDVNSLSLAVEGHTLLAPCSFTLRPGELLGVIGPNGAGKSSLLRALAGLVPPQHGEVRLLDDPLHTLSATARAQRLAYLEQQPNACWPLPVRDIVGLGLLNHGLDTTSITALVENALQTSGCAELAERQFDTLSAGERMQVHLARLFAADTPVILADEPTAALDLWHQHHLMETLRTQCERGKGMVVVLHDLALAARYCSRLLLFSQGKLEQDGAPDKVLTPVLLERCYRVRAHFDVATGTLVHRDNL
jgi:iron complex transport system ATP-binding protein